MTSPKIQLESARDGNITDEMQFGAERHQLSPEPTAKSKNIVEERSDSTGRLKDQVDNTEEIKAIETDPTLFPNSSRIYVEGEIHEGLKVPMREIRLSDTEHPDGVIEKNEPVRVYDCSGPWGDPEFAGDVTQGLPALRTHMMMGDLEAWYAPCPDHSHKSPGL